MILSSLVLRPPLNGLPQPIREVEETQSSDDGHNQKNVDDSYPSHHLLAKVHSPDVSQCVHLSFGKIDRSLGMTNTTGLLEVILMDH